MVGWAAEGLLTAGGIEGRSVGGSHLASRRSRSGGCRRMRLGCDVELGWSCRWLSFKVAVAQPGELWVPGTPCSGTLEVKVPPPSGRIRFARRYEITPAQNFLQSQSKAPSCAKASTPAAASGMRGIT